MRTIIAGSRSITDYGTIVYAMQLAANRGITPVTQLVCGMARGVDMLGHHWATERHVPIAPFPVTVADWLKVGRSAGHLRNAVMAQNADALVAIWDGHSRGTASMIRLAGHHGLKTFVFDHPRYLRERAACK